MASWCYLQNLVLPMKNLPAILCLSFTRLPKTDTPAACATSTTDVYVPVALYRDVIYTVSVYVTAKTVFASNIMTMNIEGMMRVFGYILPTPSPPPGNYYQVSASFLAPATGKAELHIVINGATDNEICVDDISICQVGKPGYSSTAVLVAIIISNLLASP